MKIRTTRRWGLTLCALLLPASVTAAPAGLTSDRNARDLNLALEWFGGEYNNDLQLWFETDPRSQTPEEQRHVRHHISNQRLSDDLMGSPAFLVREELGEGERKIIRHQVVTLQSLSPKDGILLSRYSWNKLANGQAVPDKASLEPIPNCDVILKRRAGQLEGSTTGASCRNDLVGGDQPIRETIWLGADVLTLHRIPTRNQNRTEPLTPSAFYKARIFDCDVTMFADSYLKPSDRDKSYRFTDRHDLGDLMMVESPKDGKSYHLQLRRQRYPYYKFGGEFLLMRLREVGAPTSVAIVTMDTSNVGVSLNLGWVMANCTAKAT